MSEFDPDRRKVLMASGAALTIGLAGCSGDGDSGNDSGNDSDSNGGGGSAEDKVDTYLSDNNANGYDGKSSIKDMTGQSSVTIEVGAGDGLAFGPAAVKVDSGTEVTWEWVDVSQGGHNVAVNKGPTTFSSETYASTGETYSKTLDQTGAYRYQCTPHAAQGMHGAVIVVSGGGGGNGGNSSNSSE